jgi:hypothetical protein
MLDISVFCGLLSLVCFVDEEIEARRALVPIHNRQKLGLMKPHEFANNIAERIQKTSGLTTVLSAASGLAFD